MRALLLVVVGSTLVGCSDREAIPIPVPVQIARAEGERARAVAEHVEGLAALGYSGALLVAEGGTPRLEIAFGWADRDPARPQTAATAQYWASIAKPLTAVATMRLVEEGSLSLDDPIGRHLPDAPADKAGITVRQLLAHTGGLATYHDEGVATLDREAALERIFETPLATEPGGPPAYSNSGYTLLAAILESVAGGDFRDVVRRAVLAPAGMASTAWVGNSLPGPGAHGYEDGTDQGGPADWDPASWTIYGAGGLVGPAVDLSRFADAVFGGRILDSESVATMIAAPDGDLDPTGSPDNALGWKTWRDDAGRLAVEKGGSSDKGFQGILRVYPEEDLVVVLLLNTQDVPYLLGKDALANRLVRLWRGEVQALPPAPEPDADPAAFLAAWADEAGTLRIEEDAGWIRVEAEGQPLVDVLLDHDAGERAAARAANVRARAVLTAAAQGDLGPARARLAPGRPPSVLEDLEAVVAGAASIEVLGSSREFFRDAAGFVSYVRYAEEGETRHTRLHWDPEGRLRAIGGGAFPTPVLAMLVPTGDGRAVVHHPGLGRSATARLDGDRLTVESPAGRATLRRR